MAASVKKMSAVILMSLTVTSCMVGPDFHSPAAPTTDRYTKKPLPLKTVATSGAKNGGKAQRFLTGAEIPGQWWYLYHSEELNRLIVKGINNNPTFAAAQSALRIAHENLNAQVGASFFPALSGQMLAERESFPSSNFGLNRPATVFNLFNPALNVSYTFDVFGGSRRLVESLRAQVDYANFEMIASYLTITTNIVTLAVTAASYDAQIKATHELIALQENQLKILQKQQRLGGVSGLDVLTQEAQVAALRATLPPLQQNYQQTQHALAILVGDLPSENTLPQIDLDKLSLPRNLPVSLPSDLVRQRPDIQAAEALMHSACAQIGVATANLYPQLTLSANYGWQVNALSQLFHGQYLAWDYIGTLTQQLLNGGSLLAKKRAAVATFDQAAQQYKQVVLQAFQNVADSLRAVENDAKLFQAQSLAEKTARENWQITTRQYRLGGVNYLSLLTAERQYQQAKINRIQAQAARYTDTAALFQALGGGWWNG